MATNRESNRLKEAGKRVLDEDTRQRRIKKSLESLEQDNYHEDPHSNLMLSKKLPKFSETFETRGARKKKKKPTEFKQKFRKTFAQLVEEDKYYNPDPPNYMSVQAPPSTLPVRHFCAVCGFFSNYSCVSCGTRYCSIKCYGIHHDTRCLKWTV